MTSLDPDRWRRIDELFHQALEQSASERTAFIRRAAGDDGDLAAQVRSLLVAHEQAGTALDAPAHGGAVGLLDLDPEPDLEDQVGARIGAYRITRALAAGGMGAVYLAVRDDDAYRQTVAVKLVRRGLLGSSSSRREELVRRFHVERQALANLDHPSIARLIDGGTSDDGRPYLVMEYVEGLPIDAHCETRELTLRARIELFLAVCDAVQHAHQNLIIHRDLKPGNILVTPEGVPKLLDFGLAKLLDPHRGVMAGHVTATGEFMGTFAYAAPEQIDEDGFAPDTRSDVYALGMILYRILSGGHAYDTAGAISDVLRRIRTDPPPPPSTVNHAIDTDLDTIVLKTLAKEPERRYASAGDLRGDLERYLRGEPILARGDSGWYVLRKTVRRYRAPLAAVAAFMVLLAVFAIVALTQATRLADQKASLSDALRLSNIERGRALAMAGNTALAERILWAELLSDEAKGHDAGLSWWALWTLYAQQPCRRVFAPGTGSIQELDVSSDGRWMALAADGSVLLVYDTRDDSIRQRVERPSLLRKSIRFRPGTGHLAIAGGETLEVMDVETGAIVERFDLSERVLQVGFSERGVVPLAATTHHVGTPSARLEVPGTEITSSAVSPDERWMAAGGKDGRVRLFDAARGTLVGTLLDEGLMCSCVCFSPDSRYLAADTGGTDVAVIDVESRDVIARLEGASGWIKTLAFRPDRNGPMWLAGGGYDKTVHVWEVPSGRVVRRFVGHLGPVFSARFTHDGRDLITTGAEGIVRTWELAELACLTRWPSAGTVFDLEHTSDGQRVICSAGGSEHGVQLRDAGTGDVARELPHDDLVSSLALAKDDARLLSGGYDGSIRLWQLDETGERSLRWSIPPVGEHIGTVEWAPDGSSFVSAGEDGIVRLHDPRDGRVTATFDLECDRIPSLRWSPDGRVIAAAVLPRNTIVLIDPVSGTRREILAHAQTIRIVRFSADGTMLASAGDDLVVRIWSMTGATPTLAAEMTGHQQDIFAMAFAPDGSLLATAGRRGDIKLWSPRTGEGLATFNAHTDMLFALAFSPDGSRLLSAGRGEFIGVWDLAYYRGHIEGNRVFQVSGTDY